MSYLFLYTYIHIYIYIQYMYIYIHKYIIYIWYVWYLICGVDTPYCNLTVTKKAIAFFSGVLSARFEFLMLEFLSQAKKTCTSHVTMVFVFFWFPPFSETELFYPIQRYCFGPILSPPTGLVPRKTGRAHCIPGRFALWMLMQMATWRVLTVPVGWSQAVGLAS